MISIISALKELLQLSSPKGKAMKAQAIAGLRTRMLALEDALASHRCAFAADYCKLPSVLLTARCQLSYLLHAASCLIYCRVSDV